MRKHLSFLALALLIGGAALATSLDYHLVLQWFKGGVAIGTQSTIANTANTITGSQGRCIDYDFPACATFGAGGTTACHGHTPAFWLDGGQVGDTCIVSSNVTVADGGLLDDVQFDCSVVTPNRAIVRYHVTDTDAGLTNIGDAGYCVRTFSNSTQY